MPPVMREVFSSNVERIGHDAETGELYVGWKGGKTSVYTGVPADVADSVMNDWSVGKAVRSQIQPAYAHRYVS